MTPHQLGAKEAERIDALIEQGETVRSKGPAPNKHYLADRQGYVQFHTSALSYLGVLFGEGSLFRTRFAQLETPYASSLEDGIGILSSAAAEIRGGHLTTVKSVVEGEVFEDLLDLAQHLLDEGYKDPAAMAGGAVLEAALRRVASARELSGGDIKTLNDRLAQAGVYSRLIQKKVQVWNDVRNHAAHGEFGEYDAEDVGGMLDGVRSFVGRVL